MPSDSPTDSAIETLQRVFALAQQGLLGYFEMLSVSKLLVDAGNLPLATELHRIWLAHTTSPLTHNVHLAPVASLVDPINLDAGTDDPLPANIARGVDVEAICAAYDAGGYGAAVAEVRSRLRINDNAIAVGIVEYGLTLRGARVHTALLMCACFGPTNTTGSPGP